MRTVETNALIQRLTQDLTPVMPLPLPSFRLLEWSIVAVICVGLGTLILGFRSDLPLRIQNPIFNAETLSILALALSSTFLSLSLAIPANRVPRFIRVFPWVGLILWAGLVVTEHGLHFRGVSRYLGIPGLSLDCVRDNLALSLIPGFVLFYFLGKAAPLAPGKSGFFATMAVSALAAFALQFVCREENTCHLLISHYLPVLALGLLGGGLGKKFLRW